MKKGLLWGCGWVFLNYVHLIKFHELLKTFEIIGVCGNDMLYSEIKGYKAIDKRDITNIEFDFVIVMTNDNVYREVRKEALDLGIDSACIFSWRVLLQDNFDLCKYLELKKNPPSILSNNCWGGVTYHSLDIEFSSPLINMFESDSDYLKLLKEPHRYFCEELRFLKMSYDVNGDLWFPVVQCGDIILNFNHYDSFEKAVECWERRKKRINWNNLFVMMYTEDYEMAKEFVSLPYEKKICFVPFEAKEDSLLYVELVKCTSVPFWKFVTGMASGEYPYYDAIDLLKEAKITKIATV